MPPAPETTIRPATVADLPAINAIYNHYVLNSTCTYQTEPENAEARLAWFTSHGPRHPIIVAERGGIVLGWGSLSPFHPRAAYGRTVENSVYVDAALHRQGIGRAILAALIDQAQAIGHHTIIALIDAEQTASVAIHETMGFGQVGRLGEVGFKFGRWLDVIYMQKMLRH